MRIYSLLAVVLLATVQSLKQIRIGVPRNARSFIQQQSEEKTPSNDWLNKPNHQKRNVIFERYPTLIQSQATQIYEETSSTESFGVKRLFNTRIQKPSKIVFNESSYKEKSLKTDQKTSQKLILSAEDEKKIKNSNEDKFKEIRKDEKTKNGFLIYQYLEDHKKNPKISIDQYHENFLGKKNEIKQKNEEIDVMSEETTNLAEVTKFIDDLETLQNSSFVTSDDEQSEFSVPTNLTSSLNQTPKISKQSEEQKSNDLDSKTTVLPKSTVELKLEPSTTTKSIRKKTKKILYPESQKLQLQRFPNDKQTTVPKSSKFRKRFKLDDPEDEKPEELLIFRRARERTTAIPVTPAQSSFIIEDEEIAIQRTTFNAIEEMITTEPTTTTTTTPTTTTTTKKSKKRRRRKKSKKKKKNKEEKIEQLNSIGSFKTTLVVEPTVKVLGSKTFVDGSTFSNSKESTSEKDLKKAEIPRKSHQFRKRTIAPYKSQIKQYFVTTPPKEVIEMPAIVDKETKIGYTGKQLAQMCDETKHMGHSWGISDISDFALKNCPLIRLYYPNVSCSQINQFIAYCNTNHLF